MVNVRKDIQGDTYMEKMEEQGIKKKKQAPKLGHVNIHLRKILEQTIR